jgi:hypothetical protein
MPLLVLGVLSVGGLAALLYVGAKRKAAGVTSGATPFPTNPSGKSRT